MGRTGCISARGREAGFSLLELLVVLAIMALVLGVVAMRPTAGSARVGMDVLTRHLASQLQEARISAIRANRDAVFVLDLDKGAYGVDGTSYTLPKDVDVRMVTARQETTDGVGRIRFYPGGGSTGGRLEVRKGERQMLVRVDWLTGHIHVERGRRDG